MDPALIARLAQMFPEEMAKWQATQTPQQAAQAPASPSPAMPQAPDMTVGGLGGLGGVPKNQYAPDNATDFMWLQQHNPGQLWQLSQDEMAKAGQNFDPLKSQWQGWSRFNDQYGKPIERGTG